MNSPLYLILLVLSGAAIAALWARPIFTVDCSADDHKPDGQRPDTRVCDVCGDEVTTYVTTRQWRIAEIGLLEYMGRGGTFPYAQYRDEIREARVEVKRDGETFTTRWDYNDED